MFSCTRVSGWERHVAVALVGGDHCSQFAPSVCFRVRMLLWDSFLSKDTVGQGLKPGNARSDAELFFFSYSFGQKKSLKDGGSWPPVFGVPDFPEHPSPNDQAFHPSPKKPSGAHPLQIWEAASPKPVITFPHGVGLSSSLLFFFFFRLSLQI